MKEENDIYQDYLKYNHNKPKFFNKEEHWKNYLDGYEMGHKDATEEYEKNIEKELGMDLEKFPLNVEEQFKVIKEALQDYYKNKK